MWNSIDAIVDTSRISATATFQSAVIILFSPPPSKVPGESSPEADPTKLTWRNGGSAPRQFSVGKGRAVVHDSTAYFSYDDVIYAYTVSDSKWILLPQCMYQHFGMAVVRRELMTVGGTNSSLITNALYSLSLSHLSWRKVLPPMPTGRVKPAVIATNTRLVVAARGLNTAVVEVLSMDTLQWLTAAHALPKSNYAPHMTISSEKIYLRQGGTFSSCSLQEMIQSCKPTNPKGDSVWTTIAKAPEPYATPMVTFGEHVLTIGGSRDLII